MEGSSADEPAGRNRGVVLRGIVLAVVLVAVVVLWLLLPTPTVDDIRRDIEGAGVWGGLVFAVGYGIASLVPIPKSVVSIAAGIVFGFWWGVLLVTVGSIIGATLAFLLGRRLGKDLVERFLGGRLDKVDDALSDRGLKAVLIVRVIPVLPFTLVNYSAGLTRVNRRDYALGTLIGMLPGTLVFVAIGAFGFTLGWPFFIAAAIVVVLGGLVWLLVRRLRGLKAQPAS